MWFWQYKIKVIDVDNSAPTIIAGLVVADDMVGAVKELDDYYGNDIIDILGLKAITENIFEFTAVRDEGFDYDIIYNPKNE